MVLSEDNIIAFQKLYKERFGLELSKEEASEKGAALLRLMSAVYRPMTKKQLENVRTRKQALSKKR